ncbi:Serine/threonine-protein kinase par-1 [Porphyridium purpureum]|uniref:Serine/threonine-protein kinase par-1 n=1 Tax=Porphyridium purpureum TaxID=35688 RepID=A0A5J4YPK5_PORPP|nr:Serine/threonine-protein kinase par-1 [Porphyridium purpureum]|eukprot:POR5114..scf295_9
MKKKLMSPRGGGAMYKQKNTSFSPRGIGTGVGKNEVSSSSGLVEGGQDAGHAHLVHGEKEAGGGRTGGFFPRALISPRGNSSRGQSRSFTDTGRLFMSRRSAGSPSMTSRDATGEDNSHTGVAVHNVSTPDAFELGLSELAVSSPSGEDDKDSSTKPPKPHSPKATLPSLTMSDNSISDLQGANSTPRSFTSQGQIPLSPGRAYRHTEANVVRGTAVVRTGFLGLKKKTVDVEIRNGGYITARDQKQKNGSKRASSAQDDSSGDILFERSISTDQATVQETSDGLRVSFRRGKFDQLSFSSSTNEDLQRLSGSMRVAKMEVHYKVGTCIGTGAYASVYEGYVIDTDEPVAIKIMAKKADRPQINAAIDHEAQVLRIVDHPNVIKALDVYESTHTAKIVLEYMPDGSVFDRIKRSKRMCIKEDLSKHIFRQVVEGLAYLHDLHIVHADIKAENVLLDGETAPDLVAKITDFGLSLYLEPGTKQSFDSAAPRGTPEYYAPELAHGEAFDNKIDIWACGILLYVMLGGSYPFHGQNAEETVQLVRTGKLIFPSAAFHGVSGSAQALIRRMLQTQPEARPSAHEILEDPWFESSLLGRTLKKLQQKT